MPYPKRLNQIRTLREPEDKEIHESLHANGIEVGVRVSGSTTGPLQDAFIFAKTRPGLARPGALRKLFQDTAVISNRLAPNSTSSAVARVLYIPSDKAEVSKDKVATLGTGDTHLMIVSIDGDQIEADLRTNNHHDSRKFFSAANAEAKTIRRSDLQTAEAANILPAEDIIDLSAYRKSENTRLIAIVMTDGVFKGIDNHTISDSDKAGFEAQMVNVVTQWLNGDDRSMIELSDLLVKNARAQGQTDCATPITADITNPAKGNGVLIGAGDGAKTKEGGGGLLAQAIAIIMSQKATETKPRAPEIIPL